MIAFGIIVNSLTRIRETQKLFMYTGLYAALSISAAHTADGTPNLLRNASFESTEIGWFANNYASSVNHARYDAAHYGVGYAHDGSGFLEMNALFPMGSMAQDVTVSTLPGQSYSFSVWLRAAPGVNSVSGLVYLWGIGGKQESGSTSFKVGSEWTLITAPLDVQNTGHTSLRAEIYMQTTAANLDADGASLSSAGLRNASFESTEIGWFANNYASSVNHARYDAAHYGVGYAHDGSGFLEMNALFPMGSMAQDVTVSTLPGQSYSFSVWLRAAPGVNSVSGLVYLWGIGGKQESGSTSFKVGSEWTLITAPLDVQNTGHTSLRAEIYMQTTAANLDADGASLSSAGLRNASFESTEIGWFANNYASSVNHARYDAAHYGVGYAHDGSGFLEMNALFPMGSMAQDVTVSTLPGQSYSFSVWLRAAPGVNSVSGLVYLWGIGGKQESGSTSFKVGSEWTLITAPLDVQNTGHTSLRAEIYMQTTAANLDADGGKVTTIPIPSVPSPAPSPSPSPSPAPPKVSGSIALNYSWNWSSGKLDVVGSAPQNAKVTSVYISSWNSSGCTLNGISLTHGIWTDIVATYNGTTYPKTYPFTGQSVSGAWIATPIVIGANSSSTLHVSVVVNWTTP